MAGGDTRGAPEVPVAIEAGHLEADPSKSHKLLEQWAVTRRGGLPGTKSAAQAYLAHSGRSVR